MFNNGLKIEVKMLVIEKNRKDISNLLVKIENNITAVLDDEFKDEVMLLSGKGSVITIGEKEVRRV